MTSAELRTDGWESRPRTGGDVVIETLTALGARQVFGVPGQHALGLFDSLIGSSISFSGMRVENNAVFAADGYSRSSGEVGVVFVSTGPGALTALSGMQEAFASSVPLVVISSQIPSSGLGAGRQGYLHQLSDQKSSASDVSKSQATAFSVSSIPSVIEDAWRLAMEPAQGPVWVEIPQDVLLATARIPIVKDVGSPPGVVGPREEMVEKLVDVLERSPRVAILAGGGVRRSGPEALTSLIQLAERLDAPVACSVGGNSVFPFEHELSLGHWIEDRHVSAVLEKAETLLVLGSSVGEVTSNYGSLTPRGQVLQIDADWRMLESNYSALGMRSDIGAAIAAILLRLGTVSDQGRSSAKDWWGRSGANVAAETRHLVAERLDAQSLDRERAIMADIRAGVPAEADTYWDMTIAGYWAWNCWDAKSGMMSSGQGAGGLGYALPAAIGSAVAKRQPVLAVSGDGSAMYSISELGTLAQHRIPVVWLIIDDGGYGILEEYMKSEFGRSFATDLTGPEFSELARSFGVDAKDVKTTGLREAIETAFESESPTVLVLKESLRMWAPSHLTDKNEDTYVY